MLTDAALAIQMSPLDGCSNVSASGSRKTSYVPESLPQVISADNQQKYVKGKPCKPYNSTLGEFFRVSYRHMNSSTHVADMHAVSMGG